MKRVVLICLLCSCLNLEGQIVYNWINVQYDAGDNSEYPTLDVMHLNGSVKSIYESVALKAADKKESYYQRWYTFHENGQINRIKTVEKDSSESIAYFHYNDQGNAEYARYIYIFNYGERRDSLVQDTTWFGDPPRPDSSLTDSSGNVVYIFHGGDETFTCFDNYGRKTRDSIPDSGHTMGGIFDYTYKKGKVIVDYKGFAREFSTRTIYWVDDQGNWVRQKQEANKENSEVTILREIIYY